MKKNIKELESFDIDELTEQVEKLYLEAESKLLNFYTKDDKEEIKKAQQVRKDAAQKFAKKQE